MVQINLLFINNDFEIRQDQPCLFINDFIPQFYDPIPAANPIQSQLRHMPIAKQRERATLAQWKVVIWKLVIMGKSSTSEPHTALTQWQNSLPFKFSLYPTRHCRYFDLQHSLVILSIQRQQVLDQQAVLNQNYGQLIIAKLQEMTSQVETVVGSISSIAKLYRYDHEQLVKPSPACWRSITNNASSLAVASGRTRRV